MPIKHDPAEIYEIGYNAGLDALASIDKTVQADALQCALVGLLTAACNCTYSFAPTEEAATELIEVSRNLGLEDFKKQKGAE